MLIIHGWGTDDRIWPEWLRNEGYCYSKNFPQFEDVEQEFLNYFSVKQNKVIVLGWSLGSMLALELANKHGDKIAGLTLVAPTAKFINSDDYQAGLPSSVLKNLQRKLIRNKLETQKNFYGLMFSKNEASLKDKFIDDLAPLFYDLDIDSLQKGLMYLKEQDLRFLLHDIKVPAVIISGTEDDICLPQAAEFLYSNLAKAKLFKIAGAGHIPFLTQEAFFNNILEQCWQGDEAYDR